MKKIIGFFIMAAMLAGTILPGFSVSADAVTEKPYLSLGADLKSTEKSKLLDLL